MTPTSLRPAQKRSLYRDGFVVLPRVVEGDRVQAARHLIPERHREVYPEALCDIWREWPGMAEIVAAEQSTPSR